MLSKLSASLMATVRSNNCPSQQSQVELVRAYFNIKWLKVMKH